MISYFDGKYMPLENVHISPLDFGFIHSHATYDVMRGMALYNEHYKRFSNSCEFYGFKPPSKERLRTIIEDLLTEPDMFVWMAMWKGTPPSGSPRDMDGPDHLLVYTKKYYGISDKPISLTVNEDIPRSPGYQHAKNFSWIELTHAQRNKGSFDSAIIRNVDGYINEGPGFGICFVKDNIVYTPYTDVLPSVTVDMVERICVRDLGLRFIRCDFYDTVFDEAFICSTSGGITAVYRIDDMWYNTGMKTITQKIKEKYDSLY